MRYCLLYLQFLGVVLCLPATAEAVITVSFGNWFLPVNDTIVVPIMISTDASEEISAVDLYLQVEDGISPGPFATAIEFLDHPTLPDPIFNAVSSSVVAYGDPWEVENGGGSTGLKPAYAVFANAVSGPNADVPASGVLAYVTFSSVGAPFNNYFVSFTMDDLGVTLMAKPTGTLEPGVDYFLIDGSFFAPEPSAGMLALVACGCLAWAGWRRVRARRIGSIVNL